MLSWQNAILTEYWVDKMTSCQNDKLTKCHGIEELNTASCESKIKYFVELMNFFSQWEGWRWNPLKEKG
jgi:hypothetical protein